MTYDWESNFTARGKMSAGIQASQAGDAVLLDSNGKVPDAFLRKGQFKYTMNFNPTTFATDPEACLTYADDAVGFTRVDGSAATVLSSHSAGSWGENNPLIHSLRYVTIDSSGNVHHVLDPTDLSKDINGHDRSTEITEENVMLEVPTLYSRRTASAISISNIPEEGTPYAHTFDGETYGKLYIGVYEGTLVNGTLMSVSGAVPARNKTRAEFRTAANANGDGFMLTNWHIRQLIRDFTIFPGKTFDSQRNYGQGFSTGGSNSNLEGLTTGLANALGRYAGNPAGTSNVVKCLIENPWASKWKFIDDILTAYDDAEQAWLDIMAGQHLIPTDDTTKMVKIGTIVTTNKAGSTNTFATAIQTSNEAGWGIWDNTSGDDATGLCDKHWSNPSAQRLAICGGGSADGSADGCSTLILHNAASLSAWNVGARLAFVRD